MNTSLKFCVNLEGLSGDSREHIEHSLKRAGIHLVIVHSRGSDILHVAGNNFGWLGPASTIHAKEIPTQNFLKIFGIEEN